MHFTGKEKVLLLTSLGKNVSPRGLREIDEDPSLSRAERDNEIKSLNRKYMISEYFFVYYLFAYKDSSDFITNLPVIIDIDGSEELQQNMMHDLHKLGAETQVVSLKECDPGKIHSFLDRRSRKRESFAQMPLADKELLAYKKQKLDEIIRS